MARALAVLAELSAFPRRFARQIGAIPVDRLCWSPESWAGVPGEPFTPIEHACHLRDIEVDGYHHRIRRTLQEERPTLVSLDGLTMARERDYASADLGATLEEFAQARAITLELLAGLDEAAFDRRADFEGYGQVTVRSLVHLLSSHDEQHLAGLQWLLGHMCAKGSGEEGGWSVRA